MADEESGFGGREVAGVDDEVAFVFAGFVVEDDKGFAAGCEEGLSVGCSVQASWGTRAGMGGRTEGFYCFGDGVEGGLGGAGSVWLLVEGHCGWVEWLKWLRSVIARGASSRSSNALA